MDAATATPPTDFVPRAAHVQLAGDLDTDATPVKVRGTWAYARDRCAALGQQLAVVSSAADQAALESVLDATSSPVAPRYFWIGGSDSMSEGTWRWLDGTAVTYFAWGTGQPAQGIRRRAGCGPATRSSAPPAAAARRAARRGRGRRCGH